MISQLEKFLGQFNIPFSYVDTKQLLNLSEQEFEKFSEDDLLNCIANKAQIIDAIKNPKQKFKGP